MKPTTANRWLHRIMTANALILAALGLLAFIIPGFLVIRHLADPALRGPGVPVLAHQLHRRLAGRLAEWAPARIASGKAGRLALHDVPSTEWPMFTCVFFLLATENLQREWEKTHPPDAPGAPAVYAHPALEAAAALVADPTHHTWVRQHWGEDYWHTQNVFFRSLVIAALARYEQLTGNARHHDRLVDQAKTLAAELDASPHGVLEDYPAECYPIDVLASIAWIADSDRVTGLDHRAFAERARRGFTGSMLDPLGLPPFFVENYRSGRSREPSRGTGNSWILIHAPNLWPDLAREWYARYEESFWQERALAAGFREYPRDMPELDWGFDIDAGPILAGFSPAANAFGLAAARVNGRFDHAWPLAAQSLTAAWPLPNGTLLTARALSSAGHAPYLGETAILYLLTAQPAAGTKVVTGGKLPGFVFVGLAVYFLLGALFIGAGISVGRRGQQPLANTGAPHPGLQMAAWSLFLLAAVACVLLGRIQPAVLALCAAQFLPRGRMKRRRIGASFTKCSLPR